MKWQLLTYTLIAYKERKLGIATSGFLLFLTKFFLLAKQCCMQKSNSQLFSSPNFLPNQLDFCRMKSVFYL